ncbi:MAG: hypothetical protein K0S34_253 [Bacillales bacterium]|jgi:uncharacterized protein (TIGR02271 family)|nr:hypothetical protein [Bacillales bacterium]
MDHITKLTLHEEQAEIKKNWTKINDVIIKKNIITEEKTFVIPIKREELIIEKITIDGDVVDTIRIPLTEEKVEINKTKKTLEDVSIYKEKLKGDKHININLLKEKLNIDINGDILITNKEFK